MRRTNYIYTIVRNGYESKFYTLNGIKQQKRWYRDPKDLLVNIYRVELEETQDFDTFKAMPRRLGVYLVEFRYPDYIFKENIIAESDTQALLRARSIIAKMGRDYSAAETDITKVGTCVL